MSQHTTNGDDNPIPYAAVTDLAAATGHGRKRVEKRIFGRDGAPPVRHRKLGRVRCADPGGFLDLVQAQSMPADEILEKLPPAFVRDAFVDLAEQLSIPTGAILAELRDIHAGLADACARIRELILVPAASGHLVAQLGRVAAVIPDLEAVTRLPCLANMTGELVDACTGLNPAFHTAVECDEEGNGDVVAELADEIRVPILRLLLLTWSLANETAGLEPVATITGLGLQDLSKVETDLSARLEAELDAARLEGRIADEQGAAHVALTHVAVIQLALLRLHTGARSVTHYSHDLLRDLRSKWAHIPPTPK